MSDTTRSSRTYWQPPRSLPHPRTRRIYRYHYDACGRLASHCYKLAIGETL